MSETIAEDFSQLREHLRANHIQAFRSEFLDLHIYDQGQFYLKLEEDERQLLYAYLSPKEMADMFDVLEEEQEDVEGLLKEMKPSYVAEMLAEMYTDNAVDTLKQLDRQDVAKYLSIMSKESATEIKNLLHYEDETAGAIMTTEYVAIESQQTVGSRHAFIKRRGK